MIHYEEFHGGLEVFSGAYETEISPLMNRLMFR